MIWWVAMNKLRALDSAIIELVQEAYLWLWDRTGVYVATLIFTAYAIDQLASTHMRLFNFLTLGIMGACCGVRYVAQGKNLRHFNDMQRQWRHFFARGPVMVAIALFILQEVALLDGWQALGDVAFMSWCYLACVQVRDREPKNFLSFRKPASA